MGETAEQPLVKEMVHFNRHMSSMRGRWGSVCSSRGLGPGCVAPVRTPLGKSASSGGAQNQPLRMRDPNRCTLRGMAKGARVLQSTKEEKTVSGKDRCSVYCKIEPELIVSTFTILAMDTHTHTHTLQQRCWEVEGT